MSSESVSGSISQSVFQDWGLIDYQNALNKQLELVESLNQITTSDSTPEHPGFIIFCSHPAVVTIGRQTKPEDIFSWKGDIIEVSRGGRATYHGPSQLVVYPIINLKKNRANRGPQEVRGYLRALEQAIVETLKEYGLTATGKTPQKLKDEPHESEETGVWIVSQKTALQNMTSQKIASLGIAVKKWITYHGAAINLDYDPEAFQGLNPCGFRPSTMISLEQLLNRKVNRKEFSQILLKQLRRLL